MFFLKVRTERLTEGMQEDEDDDESEEHRLGDQVQNEPKKGGADVTDVRCISSLWLGCADMIRL